LLFLVTYLTVSFLDLLRHLPVHDFKVYILDFRILFCEHIQDDLSVMIGVSPSQFFLQRGKRLNGMMGLSEC